MTRSPLLVSLLVLSACVYDVTAPGQDDQEWEDIEDMEDIDDPGAFDEETWEALWLEADRPDPEDIAEEPGIDPADEVGATSEALTEDGPGPFRDPCRTLRPTIRGTNGADHIVGTPGRDIIFGYGGDDRIDGRGGNDVICAGFGQDVVHGGDGDDYIDLGGGNDIAYGERGSDTIHGRSGSDIIHGNAGNDFLHGDILDDRLYGDGGNDLLVGGHGKDRLHGGTGNDWLRGDTGNDSIEGGAGDDTVSFMTAMPPGQPASGVTGFPDGIVIVVGREIVSGDGHEEGIDGVETIIGSPFDDHFRSGDRRTRLVGGLGNDTFETHPDVEVEGGAGVDTCNGAECEPGMEAPHAPTTAFAYVDARPRDTGLVVMGAAGDENDELDILMRGGTVHVIATGGPGISPGAGCDARGTHEVACRLEAPFRYVMAWGGDGDDTIRIGNGFPRDFTSHVGGGHGSDRLFGGSGQDVLFTGLTGRDRLYGGPGDDALMGESPRGPKPRGEAYAGEPDYFHGGPGNDQLVSDYPCGHHRFIGGGGLDIAGFARVGTTFPAAEREREGIRAQLGGRAAASERTAFYGRAYQPHYCGLGLATILAGDLEILEGAGGNDLLHGNDRANFIWGWGGDDVLDGHGGNDFLAGHEGNDRVIGGEGVDRMLGGAGSDVIVAGDGRRDAEISCGAGGSRASIDVNRDPEPRQCGGGGSPAPGSISSHSCAGVSCVDDLGSERCEGERGSVSCGGGGIMLCTCTAGGFASCGACVTP